jgi:hypothetical protein
VLADLVHREFEVVDHEGLSEGAEGGVEFYEGVKLRGAASYCHKKKDLSLWERHPSIGNPRHVGRVLGQIPGLHLRAAPYTNRSPGTSSKSLRFIVQSGASQARALAAMARSISRPRPRGSSR